MVSLRGTVAPREYNSVATRGPTEPRRRAPHPALRGACARTARSADPGARATLPTALRAEGGIPRGLRAIADQPRFHFTRSGLATRPRPPSRGPPSPGKAARPGSANRIPAAPAGPPEPTAP